jgi:hypothetical protein
MRAALALLLCTAVAAQRLLGAELVLGFERVAGANSSAAASLGCGGAACVLVSSGGGAAGALLAARSGDRGASFGALAPVADAAVLGTPRVSCTANSNCVAVWAESDGVPYSARSPDGGLTWQGKVALPVFSAAGAASPVVACSANNVCVVALETQSNPLHGLQLYTSASGGASWSPALTLETGSAGLRWVAPSVSCSSSGDQCVLAYAQQNSSGPAAVHSRRLTSGAQSVSPRSAALATSALREAAQGRPSVACAGRSCLLAVEASGNSLQSVLVARSADGGLTWTTPVELASVGGGISGDSNSTSSSNSTNATTTQRLPAVSCSELQCAVAVTAGEGGPRVLVARNMTVANLGQALSPLQLPAAVAATPHASVVVSACSGASGSAFAVAVATLPAGLVAGTFATPADSTPPPSREPTAATAAPSELGASQAPAVAPGQTGGAAGTGTGTGSSNLTVGLWVASGILALLMGGAAFACILVAPRRAGGAKVAGQALEAKTAERAASAGTGAGDDDDALVVIDIAPKRPPAYAVIATAASARFSPRKAVVVDAHAPALAPPPGMSFTGVSAASVELATPPSSAPGARFMALAPPPGLRVAPPPPGMTLRRTAS